MAMRERYTLIFLLFTFMVFFAQDVIRSFSLSHLTAPLVISIATTTTTIQPRRKGIYNSSTIGKAPQMMEGETTVPQAPCICLSVLPHPHTHTEILHAQAWWRGPGDGMYIGVRIWCFSRGVGGGTKGLCFQLCGYVSYVYTTTYYVRM